MIKQWIENNIPNNAIVLEAGTCEGGETLFFAKHLSSGIIYGFEPIPPFFNDTKELVKNYKNVELYQLALDIKSGKSTMYLSENIRGHRNDKLWGSSSILKTKEHLKIHQDIIFKNSIEVNTINLDEWFISKKLEKIDFIWFDLQGYEPNIVKSSPITISKTKYLYTEVNLLENYQDNIIYNDFKEYLSTIGFEKIKEYLPYKDAGNVLFINKKMY